MLASEAEREGNAGKTCEEERSFCFNELQTERDNLKK